MRTGGSPSSPLLGAYCGGSPPPATLKSTGNQMFIRFYSNRDSTQLQGFSASYTSYVEGKIFIKYFFLMSFHRIVT